MYINKSQNINAKNHKKWQKTQPNDKIRYNKIP